MAVALLLLVPETETHPALIWRFESSLVRLGNSSCTKGVVRAIGLKTEGSLALPKWLHRSGDGGS